MTHTLISFLGRVPKGENGYRTTRYQFDDVLDEPTAFIGWSLRRHLNPDRMVILGTAGSMWDHLFEKDFVLGSVAEDERLALQVATETKTVTEELLEPLMPILTQRLGCEVRLVLIPYCQNELEQLELLRLMAAEVNPGDQVNLDVTHGFRHLPMLAMLSALHLKEVKKAEIAGVWYGLYDHDTKEAPVYNLGGLLRIADWLGALHTFDKDGDYGVFADLMEKDGAPTYQANYLRRAAFRERTSNAYEACTDLKNLDTVLKSGLPGVSALFNDQLRERIRWHRGQNLRAWQRELAIEYLERGDYVRSVIFALEGFETSLVDRENNEEEWNFSHREKAVEEYWDGLRGPQALRENYAFLNGLRNALAHGTRPKDSKLGRKIERTLSDPKLLQEELRRLIKKLLPR
ncbi:MAG: family CRISPR-associated protein [Pseudomonadota bacterium]|nr:family CRISPR-associated protein [Pseudomonadota bacterium]